MKKFIEDFISVIAIIFLLIILLLIVLGVRHLYIANTTPSDGRIPTTEQELERDEPWTVRPNTERRWGDTEDD